MPASRSSPSSPDTWDSSPDAPPVDRDRLAAQQRELLARLEAEPGVTGVAFSSGMPGFGATRAIRFQDGVRVRARAEYIPDVGITDALLPSMTRVSVDAFDTYGVEIACRVAISRRLTSAPPTSSSIAASSTCICRNRMRSVCCFATRTRPECGAGRGIRSSAWCATSRRSRSTSRENGSPPSTIQPASGTFLACCCPCGLRARCRRRSSTASATLARRSIPRCN